MQVLMVMTIVLLTLSTSSAAAQGEGPALDRFRAYMASAEAALAEPFQGIEIVTDQPADDTAFSFIDPPRAAALRAAATQLIAATAPDDRRRLRFALNSDEHRRWSNIHRYPRAGLPLLAMNSAQRAHALRLAEVALGAAGYARLLAIMTADQVLAERTGRHEEYGAKRYWFSIMGEPVESSPWRLQIDGHHLAVNVLISGDHVVGGPVFMGAEPVHMFDNSRIFNDEETLGVAVMRALSPAQRAAATVAPAPPRRDVIASAFKDNVVIPIEGLAMRDVTDDGKQAIQTLVAFYLATRGVVAVTEVPAAAERVIRDARWVWKGGIDDAATFYYRLQSPRLLIEFAHQPGVAIDNPAQVSRNQVHTVVRLPGGIDYGAALLSSVRS